LFSYRESNQGDLSPFTDFPQAFQPGDEGSFRPQGFGNFLLGYPGTAEFQSPIHQFVNPLPVQDLIPYPEEIHRLPPSILCAQFCVHSSEAILLNPGKKGK
jgi:hypothetical protein